MPAKASFLKSPPLRDATLLINICFEDGCYFNVDNFEDCYFTDGHQEDSCLNDGQGVYKTPGADQEASTPSLAIKAQLLPL